MCASGKGLTMKTLDIDDGSIIVWIHNLRAVVKEIRDGLALAESHPPTGYVRPASVGAMAAVPFVRGVMDRNGNLPMPPVQVAFARAKAELRQRADVLEAMAQRLEEIQTVQGCHLCGGSQQVRGVGSRRVPRCCPVCTEVGRQEYEEMLSLAAGGDGSGN